jgi:hypothetical protein
MKFAVGTAILGSVAAWSAVLGFAGAVLHTGVVLVAVTAGGVGLAFAAVALARGAQALGGVGERERDEEDERSQRRDQAAAEWGEGGS